MHSSDRRVRQALVLLAGTLVTDFYVNDFLGVLARLSVDLLDVTASEILLAAQAKAGHGEAPRWAGVSTTWPCGVALPEPPNGLGPGLDAFRRRSQVWSSDLAVEDRWPDFTVAARAAGFGAVHAFPMRLDDRAMGAMNLFSAQAGGLGVEAVELGQAFADMASIGLLSEQARHSGAVIEQLESLRDYTRKHRLSLSEAAYSAARREPRVTPTRRGEAPHTGSLPPQS